jgi:hypothetical protein
MIRLRFYSLTLSLPFLIFASGIVVAFADLNRLSDALILVGAALALVFSITVACPRCGKSPYAWGKVGSIYLGGKSIPDHICSRCGYDLVHGGDPTPIKAPATASEVCEKADGSKPL